MRKNRTITEELVVVLSLILCLIVGVIGGLSYYHFSQTRKAELHKKAGEISNSLAETLAMPVWNLDQETIHYIVEASLKIDAIQAITVADENGELIYTAGDPAPGPVTFTEHREIFYTGQLPSGPRTFRIGALQILYSGQGVVQTRRRIILLTTVTAILVVLAMILVTNIVLRKMLRNPLDDLERGITKIAGGDYRHHLTEVPEADVNRIIQGVNRMADQIAERTSTLQAEIDMRRQADRSLHESKEKYYVLLENNPDPVVVYDMEGRVTYFNPAFTKTFGWSLTERIGRKMNDFVPQSSWPETREMIDKVIAGETFSNVESARYTKDGRVIQVSVSGAIYRDQEGRPQGTIVNLRDISAQKHLEMQINQGEKMRAIGTLAGGIAHDVNNLLMSIQGHVSIMMLEADPGHAHYERVAAIEQCVQSGASLTKQLLGFARGGKYEVKPMNLNEVVAEHCRMFGRTRKEVVLHQQTAQDLWTVEADRGQIEQVLLNLCINAWQAMPGGGEIYIRTENLVIDKSYLAPYHVEPGRYVRLTVTDTGVGMDESTRQRIFEPFFTTRQMGKGTGMGLASVYGIVKNHDGFINVYSEVGKGTTFTIYLPAIKGTWEPAESQAREETVVKGTETVLLVDDEPQVLRVAGEMLESLGYTVQTARSGQEAIEAYSANSSADLVILDMVMPGMGGSETYERLLKINPAIRTILSSGYSINGEASEIMKKGCNAFIQKPFTVVELSRTIRSVLDRDEDTS
ncbi:MAG: PAS domain S-box protein [Desulfatibacillaceae bacterium]